MAVKTQEEIVAALSEYIGEDTSENGVALFEDVMDTMKDMLERNSVNEDEVSRRVKEVDDKWRRKYLSRFHAGIIGVPADDDTSMAEMEKEQRASTIGYDDLFQDNKRKV